jgi:RNA polymerase sigma-70 factor, ECF subfamily
MNPSTAESTSDVAPDLMTRLRRGDSAALTAIYSRFGGELLALAARLTGSKQEAEDILHDLIVGLPEAMKSYDERGKLRAWLKRIVVRMSLMRLRAASRRRETALDDAGDLVDLTPATRDTADAIELALRSLSPAVRAVVVLRFIEGHSHREIADTLGISVEASEARLSRGIAAMRSRLEHLI